MSIALRPLEARDLDHVLTWVNDPRVMRFFRNRQTVISREDEAQAIEGLIASPTDHVFSIFREPDGFTPAAKFAAREYVGQCALHQDRDVGRLFIVVRPEFQGRGYARAAILQLLRDHAWTKLGLSKVTLLVRSEHKEAISLYWTCGFRLDMRLPESYKLGEALIDMDRMSISRP